MAERAITADHLIAALNGANDETHPAQQAYLDLDEPDNALIDGRLNLERVAEMLNEAIRTRQPAD